LDPSTGAVSFQFAMQSEHSNIKKKNKTNRRNKKKEKTEKEIKKTEKKASFF